MGNYQKHFLKSFLNESQNISDGDLVPEIGFSGSWNQSNNGVFKAGLIRHFISFCTNIWHIWFFKSSKCLLINSTFNLGSCQKKKLSKNEEKPCLTCHPSLNKKHTTLPFKISLWIYLMPGKSQTCLQNIGILREGREWSLCFR